MTTNVLVTLDLDLDLVGRIEAVDPAVRVRALGRGMRASFGAKVPFPTQLQALTPRHEIEAALPDTDVLFGVMPSPPLDTIDLAGLAPRLRWIQSTLAGPGGLDPALLANVTVTTAAGVASVPIAEWVIAAMLMFAKGWPGLWRKQQAHAYDRFVPRELAGSTIGIVGLGAIGSEVATRAHAFGCRVIAMRRTVGAQPHPLADEMVPPSELHTLLRASDYVVLAAPLTDQTRGLIDAAALSSMKPDAVLINVARGGLVDEAALVDALRAGTIGGAALDVFAVEPLPADSPLWDLEQVILSPHISAGTDRYYERATALFCENLGRYLRGEPLANVVDPSRGY